jgi:coproporphyrinogen III oxidase-like Fe-S oxidoreductase
MLCLDRLACTGAGGTPSILGAEGLASVVKVLRRRFAFEANFENAIELDPEIRDERTFSFRRNG